MSEKRVILGIPYSTNENIAGMIEKEIKEKTGDDVTCNVAYTKAAVEVLLDKDSSVLGVILLREISVSAPYTASEIIALSENHQDVVPVLLCSDDFKGSTFAQEILNGGITNMVYTSDSTISTLVGRILKPYGRREAKRYYGLNDSGRQLTRAYEGAVLSDEQYYSYLEFLREKNEMPFDEKIAYVKGLVEEGVFTAFLLRLPDELKSMIAQLDTYENFYSEQVGKPKKNKPPRQKKTTIRAEGENKAVYMCKVAGETLRWVAQKTIYVTKSAAEVLREVIEKWRVERKANIGEKKGLSGWLDSELKDFEKAIADEMESDLADGSVPAVEELPLSGPEESCFEVEMSDAACAEESVTSLKIVCEDEKNSTKKEEAGVDEGMEEAIPEGDLSPTGIVEVPEEMIREADSDRNTDVVKKKEAGINHRKQKREEKRSKSEEKNKKKNTKEKTNRVKRVYYGSMVIAVLGIRVGVGCSHTARVFANYMCQTEKRKVCLIDMENPFTSSVEGLIPEVDVLQNSDLELAYGRYDCIVLDFGTEHKRFVQDIIRANVRVLCSTADDASFRRIYEFVRTERDAERWIYSFNHAQTKAKEGLIRDRMEDYKYLILPVCDEQSLTKPFIRDIRNVLR